MAPLHVGAGSRWPQHGGAARALGERRQLDAMDGRHPAPDRLIRRRITSTCYCVPAATRRLSFTLLTPSVALAIATALVLAALVFTVPFSVTTLLSTSISMSLSLSTVFQSARYCA